MKPLFVALLLAPALLLAQPKGTLFIIGGGSRPPELMKQFIELAGGSSAVIMVIPTASDERQETGERQSKEMLSLGAARSFWFHPARTLCNSDSALALLNGVTGVFFSGGDQIRVTRELLGTTFLERLRQLYQNGGVLGGTSAGAAIMSRVMLTGNELLNKDTLNNFATVEPANVETVEGLGFLENVIIDQHFIKRKRSNRLLSVVLEHPELPALGIDEATALLVRNGTDFTVAGASSVLVYDARGARVQNRSKGFSANGIALHVLSAGDHWQVNANTGK